MPDAVDTVVCAPDDGRKYHPKHVEQFPDINKLCNVASCWIYIGILLGAQHILHISRIRVKSEAYGSSYGVSTLLVFTVYSYVYVVNGQLFIPACFVKPDGCSRRQ
jgi:hypothetical protein